MKEELRQRMHEPIPEQGGCLRQVVAGFFNYHAVPTNSDALEAFRYYVTVLWHRSLRRRSQKGTMNRERIGRLADDWLLGRVFSTLGRVYALPSNTQGGSRAPESG